MSRWLEIGVYYYLVILLLQVARLNYAGPDYGATYSTFAKIFFPEFLGTTTITTLIWFALPTRYRRPQWVMLKNAPRQSNEVQYQSKESAQ